MFWSMTLFTPETWRIIEEMIDDACGQGVMREENEADDDDE